MQPLLHKYQSVARGVLSPTTVLHTISLGLADHTVDEQLWSFRPPPIPHSPFTLHLASVAFDVGTPEPGLLLALLEVQRCLTVGHMELPSLVRPDNNPGHPCIGHTECEEPVLPPSKRWLLHPLWLHSLQIHEITIRPCQCGEI